MKREINNFTSYLKNQRNYSDYTINNYYKDLIEYSLFLNEKNYRYDDMDYKKCVDYLRWLDEKKLELVGSYQVGNYLCCIAALKGLKSEQVL